MNDPEPLILGMAPCNQEMKRRYAPLNGASEQKGRLNPRQGWIPKAGKALGGGDPQEAGRGSLLGPVRKDKKTIDLVDIQSASVSAHAKEKAYLVQVRTIQYW